jgi:hypothetical protein
MMRKAWALLSALAIALAAFGVARADEARPRVPCEGQKPVPMYAGVGEPPKVQTWKGVGWDVPACLPWPHARFRLIVALAASFRHEGDSTALLGRFGAISAMRGIRYWSVTEGDWRVLIKDAFAVDGPGSMQPRPDFAPRDMIRGADLYFVEQDNRSGLVIYRMRVLEAGADRISISTENVTPVRALGFTVFPPGSLRAAYRVQRADSNTWSFYGVSTTGEDASMLAGLSESSYINRATALYGYFTSRQ